MPFSDDIDCSVLLNLSDKIFLLKVLVLPERFRFELLGKALQTNDNAQTGRFLDEIDPGGQFSYLRAQNPKPLSGDHSRVGLGHLAYAQMRGCEAFQHPIAAGMYGQLTVGKPLHIVSRVKGEKLASEMYVSIDTARNQPDIYRKKRLKWDRPHGTRVEMEMEGHYQKGPHSVEVYLKQAAIANPHLTITYKDPHGEELHFTRSTRKLQDRSR
ncbi:hypothetical protein ACH79_26015 [Bradyrhizobium sp. CCBAU 051011]|uniref:hypothetical protein n=1 Tax=Bradyrhizobium sp. CCBAU 051011 TaxID=858422 RepID=UPI001373BAD0|nr:hypothetical protein [Bradyrhizobium sp. CCBAU 051011]QHO75577.1 hypothetical protein ACH79_26015 [Bradyrhizobium sp. CCBAU 051011]